MYTVSDVLQELAKGNWDSAFDKAYQEALSALIPVWSASRVTLDDLRALSEYSAISGTRMNARFLVGCDIAMEVSRARRALDWRDARAASMAELLP